MIIINTGKSLIRVDEVVISKSGPYFLNIMNPNKCNSSGEFLVLEEMKFIDEEVRDEVFSMLYEELIKKHHIIEIVQPWDPV